MRSSSPARASADEVVFVRDVPSGRVTWSPALREVFGYAPAEVEPTVAWALQRVHPEDADRVLTAMRDAREGRPLAIRHRFRRADGTYANVIARAYVLNDACGSPATTVGSIVDISRSAGRTPEELERMIEIVPDAVVGVDARGVIVLANDLAVRLFGYERSDLVGMGVESLVPTGSRDRHRALRASYEAHPTTRPMGAGRGLVACRSDGLEIPVDIALSAVETPAGRLTLAAVRDLSERVREADELRRQTRHVRLLRSVTIAANEAESPDDALQAAVDQVCTLLGWPVGHALRTAGGERLVSSPIWHVADPELYRGFTDATALLEPSTGDGLPGQVLAQRRPVFMADIVAASHPRGAAALRAGLRAALGCPVTVGDEVVAVLEFFTTDPLSADPQLVEVMADVGKQIGRAFERDRHLRVTTHVALHDAVTDLPNRHLLDDRLERALAMARRDDRCVALLFVDLDDFKVINDTFGHQAGDVVLREISARLRATLREQDTVARVGGDEFAVVLPNTDKAGAIDTAQKLRGALAAPLVVEGQRCQIGATVGIGVYPLHAGNPLDLVRHADIALYAAKDRGARFAVYDVEIDEYTRERLTLVDELRRGLDEGQVVCQYQPEVRLLTGEVVGVEALVRWHHPSRGLLLPADFVPLAERGGLARALTARVLADAVARARTWELAGRDLVVAINVFVDDVLDPDMADVVGAAVRGAGLSPGRLQIELTENHLLADLDLAVRNLEALRRLGVRCALDDFGAGYSSLGYLRRLPVDQLKVDGSLVAAMKDDRVSASIVKAAVSLGTDLGFDVIAEGIESAAIRELVIALGCRLGQGYALARPMPGDELDSWLRARPGAAA